MPTDAETLRNRCVSMPSRACSSFEVDRAPQRYPEMDGKDLDVKGYVKVFVKTNLQYKYKVAVKSVTVTVFDGEST